MTKNCEDSLKSNRSGPRGQKAIFILYFVSYARNRRGEASIEAELCKENPAAGARKWC